MRCKRMILILFVAVSLAGCNEQRERWPWRKKDVPVTPPGGQAPAANRAKPKPTGQQQAEAAQQQPSPQTPGDSQPPPKRQRASEPEGGNGDQVKNDAAQPQVAKASPTGQDPRRIERPTMLENLIPGARPMDRIKTLSGLAPARVRPARRAPVKPAGERAVVRPLAKPEIPARPPTERRAGPIAPAPAAPAETLQPPLPRLAPVEKIEYGKAEMVAASLIQVNERFITVDDLLRAARDRLTRLPDSMSEEAFRGRVQQILSEEIRGQVRDTLIYDEAKRRLTDQQERIVEAQLEQTLRTMIAEVGGSRSKLEAILAQRGTDLDTVLGDHRRALTVQMFLRGRFEPAISISRRQLWEVYRRDRSRFTTHKKVQMQIIAAPYGKFLPGGLVEPTADEHRAAAARAKALIEEALAAVRRGEDFGQVARRLSRGIMAARGGFWRLMQAGSLAETKVEEAAFALQEGQVSEIIQTDTGYYIVKARRIRPGRTISFEDAQDQIMEEVRKEHFERLAQGYLQRLYQGAQIRQSDEFLQLAVDRAVRIYWRR